MTFPYTLELETERIDGNHNVALVAHAGQYKGYKPQRKGQQKGARQGKVENLAPKNAVITKRHWGKRGKRKDIPNSNVKTVDRRVTSLKSVLSERR